MTTSVMHRGYNSEKGPSRMYTACQTTETSYASVEDWDRVTCPACLARRRIPLPTDKELKETVLRIRDGAPGKRMSLREFADSGLLQEANRLFFHPRGMALGLSFFDDPTFKEPTLLGPILVTDDPEGWEFGDTATLEKTGAAAERFQRYSEARTERFGSPIEPVPLSFRGVVTGRISCAAPNEAARPESAGGFVTPDAPAEPGPALWASQVEEEIARWRADPNYSPVIPIFPRDPHKEARQAGQIEMFRRQYGILECETCRAAGVTRLIVECNEHNSVVDQMYAQEDRNTIDFLEKAAEIGRKESP